MNADMQMRSTQGPSDVSLLLVATFDAMPGSRDRLRTRLEEMVPLTREEPGCLQYDLHEDRSNDHRFVFVERWVDQAALDAHMATPHVGALLRDVPELAERDVDLVSLRKL